MVRYSNVGVKTRMKKAWFGSKILRIWMVCQATWLYQLNAGHPYCPVFRWIRYSGVWYSDGSCTRLLVLYSGHGLKNWPFYERDYFHTTVVTAVLNDKNCRNYNFCRHLFQYWMPDAVSVECYECAARFTTFRRKHHCRVCGQIFCSKCCSIFISGKYLKCSGKKTGSWFYQPTMKCNLQDLIMGLQITSVQQLTLTSHL